MLLWALGYVEEGLSPPSEVCDVQRAYQTAADRPGERFLAEARPVAFTEVLDQADLAYRMHWALREIRINGEEPPDGFNPGIVYERDYALSWLTSANVAWDEVETDT